MVSRVGSAYNRIDFITFFKVFSRAGRDLCISEAAFSKPPWFTGLLLFGSGYEQWMPFLSKMTPGHPISSFRVIVAVIPLTLTAVLLDFFLLEKYFASVSSAVGSRPFPIQFYTLNETSLILTSISFSVLRPIFGESGSYHRFAKIVISSLFFFGNAGRNQSDDIVGVTLCINMTSSLYEVKAFWYRWLLHECMCIASYAFSLFDAWPHSLSWQHIRRPVRNFNRLGEKRGRFRKSFWFLSKQDVRILALIRPAS